MCTDQDDAALAGVPAAAVPAAVVPQDEVAVLPVTWFLIHGTL